MKIRLSFLILGIVSACNDIKYNDNDLLIWHAFFDDVGLVNGKFCNDENVRKNPCCSCNKNDHEDLFIHCKTVNNLKYITSM